MRLKVVHFRQADQNGITILGIFESQGGKRKSRIEFWAEFDGRDLEVDPRRQFSADSFDEVKVLDAIHEGADLWSALYNEKYEEFCS